MILSSDFDAGNKITFNMILKDYQKYQGGEKINNYDG